MVDVKTIQFTVSREVDTGLPLDIKDYARGVEPGLLAGRSDKPVRGRIGSDGGSQYFGLIIHLFPYFLHRTGRGFANSLAGQLIDRRGLDAAIPVATEVIGAHGVYGNQHYRIRRRGGRELGSLQRRAQAFAHGPEEEKIRQLAVTP